MLVATRGQDVGWQPIVVLLVWIVGSGFIATRTFRWQ